MHSLHKNQKAFQEHVYNFWREREGGEIYIDSPKSSLRCAKGVSYQINQIVHDTTLSSVLYIL